MRTQLVLASLAFVATANGGGAVALPQQVQNALTPIDSVPTKTELDAVFSDQALSNLSTIAADPTADTGIRLRAIHALTKYCTSPCNSTDTAHQTLTDFITANAGATSGATIVMLRGAIEAVGPQRVSGDLALLVPLLDHASRDIRAATAHALRDLCNTNAITPLRQRNENEPTEQVKQAITDALRVLGQPQPCQ
jgi:methyl coenzyme M reductase gamma subunit